MPAEARPAPQHLAFLRQAAGEARRYGLFPLVRGAEARAHGSPRVGASRLPSQDVVELTQTPTLQFPAPTLETVTTEGRRPRIDGYWLGLTGPMGPLPLHLTEFAYYERKYAKNQPFGRFLDLIAGRMLQFFYRAWADTQPAAQADRPSEDAFARYVAALSGATEGAREASAFPAAARLPYAAVFAGKRSAAGLQDALGHLLGRPVRLVEFHARWREIEPDDRTRAGGALGGFNRLGSDAVLGSRTFDAVGAFKIVVRNKDADELTPFLPDGERFALAAEALDAFAPTHLEWELELEIEEPKAPPVRLDGRARLGWTSWMAPQGRPAVVRADTRLRRRRGTRAPMGRPQ